MANAQRLNRPPQINRLLAGIGLAAAYGLYAAAAFVSVFFVLKYVHETKGRELEQMQG